MKTPIFKIAAVACLGVLALAAVAAYSQVAVVTQAPEWKKDHIVSPPGAGDAKEKGPLENIVKLSKPGDAQEIAIGDLFRRQPTPSIRATYFQSVLKDPKLPFKRWHLRILKVSTVDGATHVTIRAIPVLRTTAQVDGFLDETHEVCGDGLKLIKTDPPVDPKVPKRFIITHI